MNTKGFLQLLAAVLVLGVVVGGAFSLGLALGGNVGEGTTWTQDVLTPPSAPSTGQQIQDSLGEDQVQRIRQQFQERLAQGGVQPFPGRGKVLGTIEKVEGNSITVQTAQGPVQAKTDGDTTIQVLEAGSLDDLQTGMTVVVTGQPGEDGAVAATSVFVTPEGVGFGGGFLPGGLREQGSPS